MDSILSRLIYSRIIYPDSKLAIYELSKKFIEQPDFDLHQIYRALDVLAKESDLIQSTVYENSIKITPRDTRVLFYDCTNFYFEMEREAGIKQYGYSKEHRPNPIVQMGLFMDGNGIPLAFCINPGNTNEQVTMRPLEKKINNAFTCEQIIDAIREYNFLEISQKGYIPAYENSEIYSELHKQFGFYNDAEIVMYDQMNKIIICTKHYANPRKYKTT